MRHSRPDYNRIQDPLGLIPENEPVFLLRAQDQFAPDVVQAWIDAARKHNAGNVQAAHRSEPTTADVPEHTIRQLEGLIADMHIWQRATKVKVPDSPEQIAAKADSKVAVKVKISAKAMDKIIARASGPDGEIVDAAGMLRHLADRAKVELGAIMVQAKHATLSYEELPDGSFGMIGRIWDKEVIVTLGEHPDALGEIHPAAGDDVPGGFTRDQEKASGLKGPLDRIRDILSEGWLSESELLGIKKLANQAAVAARVAAVKEAEEVAADDDAEDFDDALEAHNAKAPVDLKGSPASEEHADKTATKDRGGPCPDIMEPQTEAERRDWAERDAGRPGDSGDVAGAMETEFETVDGSRKPPGLENPAYPDLTDKDEEDFGRHGDAP